METRVAAGDELFAGGDGEELRGPHFTLLAVGGDAPRRGSRRRYASTGIGGGPGPAEVHTSHGEGLYLVRPDGYVGWAGRDPVWLAGRLGKVMRC
ncbi:hypothetical protein ACISU4_16835 [Streptomyces wuyuanensis]|uniref:hypothetical protein n=1 Tax=Streptomyces wuyuanensis TaxID=1196353 RepID=UPI0037F9B033